MLNKAILRYTSIFFALATVVVLFGLSVAAASSGSMFDNKVTVSANNGGSVSVSGTTATVNGSGKNTITVTISNSGTTSITLSFNYSFGRASNCSIDGATVASSGSYTTTLASEGACIIQFTGKYSSAYLAASATLSNVSCEEVTSGSDVTLKYNSSLGSVKVDGTAVSPNTTFEVSPAGCELVAIPNNSSFLGWVDADGNMLSSALTYKFVPTAETTVQAAFVSPGSTPWFGVGDVANSSYNWTIEGYYQYATSVNRYFEGLAGAITYATSSKRKAIVLLSDGTLPAGTYTIPTGVTLLVPHDAALYMHKTRPGLSDDDYVAPATIYRTLVMENGANLIVNGELSLAGYQSADQGFNGAPIGSLSAINMKSGSTITVNSGGNLYCWGYIGGSGAVTIKSGGTVYEDFQLTTWRGGTATSNMLGNSQKVFPSNQYYIQNVQVPMTIESGASVKCVISVSVTLVGIQVAEIDFISSTGMFRITSGSVVKDYIESADRLQIDIDGTFELGKLLLEVSSYEIDSTQYVLPLTNNLTINFLSGSSSISQEVAILPGCEVYIAKDATVTLGSGANLYLYDLDQWGAYCTNNSSLLIPARYVYNRQKTRATGDLTDAILKVNGTLDASQANLFVTAGGASVYSTDAGAIKMGSTAVTETYQATQSDTAVTYVSISVALAPLKHEDGTSIRTSNSTTYNHAHYDCEHGANAKHGVWVAGKHTVTDTVTAPTCTVDGYTTHKCVCNHSYTDSTVSATGYHLWTVSENTGNAHKHSCSYGCGDSITLNVEYRLNDYLWFNGYIVDNRLDNTATITVDGGTQTAYSNQKRYIVKAIPADEIPNDIKFTITCAAGQATFTVNLKDYIADGKEALKQALLNYGEAAEDKFAEKPNGVTVNGGGDNDPVVAKPDLNGVNTGLNMGESHVTNGVTASGYGVTIGFDNCLQFIYGMNLTADEKFDWNKVVQIGLLRAPVGTETLYTSNSTMAYVLFEKNEATWEDDDHPEVPGETGTLWGYGQDITAISGKADDDGNIFLELSYDLLYVDYNAVYTYRPYVLIQTGVDSNGEAIYEASYGEQFDYGLKTYLARQIPRLEAEAKLDATTDERKAAITTELNLLYATWYYMVAAK